MRAKRTLAVGLIGYEFMGKVHSNAWRQAPRFFNLPADVQTKTICGRRRAAVKRAAATFGWANSVTDWREVVADPNIDIVDICSHIVDLARYLIGEFKEVCAITETFVRQRPLVWRDSASPVRQSDGFIPRRARTRARRGKVTVDDAVTMTGRFQNGALASLEATRFAPGRKNSIALEINGSAGSLCFDLEEMNRLKFYSRRDPQDRQGFRDIVVTEPTHPYMDKWWPPGHIICYEPPFIHLIADFVKALVAGKGVEPSFHDGLQNQGVLDAALKSLQTKRQARI